MLPNTMFPGRANYVGPTEGMFGLLHHSILAEYSHDVMERVEYVKNNKPYDEILIRLNNMIYLGGCYAASQLKLLEDNYQAQLKPINDKYWEQRKPIEDNYQDQLKPINDKYWAQLKPIQDNYWEQRKLINDKYWAQLKPIEDNYQAQRKPIEEQILLYIRKHNADCAWNGRELQF